MRKKNNVHTKIGNQLLSVFCFFVSRNSHWFCTQMPKEEQHEIWKEKKKLCWNASVTQEFGILNLFFQSFCSVLCFSVRSSQRLTYKSHISLFGKKIYFPRALPISLNCTRQSSTLGYFAMVNNVKIKFLVEKIEKRILR